MSRLGKTKKTSLALIGMSGCGKSTVGMRLAHVLGLSFLDTDKLIIERQGMDINSIFEKYGEKYFRDLEAEVVAEVSKLGGAVIATGGGVVLNPVNIHALRQNSRIVYVRRSPESIAQSVEFKNRPLLAGSKQNIFEIFRQRRKLYESYCDFAVENEGTESEAVDLILEALK